jgi:NAD-dependent deacetylase
MKPRIVVLSGAGISAESGLKTFRDANGLWEGHDVMAVASPEGWSQNPRLVLDFYNERRRQLLNVNPNEAHMHLAGLESEFEITIVTQNVDDLHERAGSAEIIHLHGELLKVRSSLNPQMIYDWRRDLFLGDVGEDGAQLRPHIVWFGEPVPMIEKAAGLVSMADALLVIGTSLQVYPAASLLQFAADETPVIYIDPSPPPFFQALDDRIHLIKEPATSGVKIALSFLRKALS